MGKISDIIDSRLDELGIKGSKMCDDLGISRSTLTELRKGRATTLNADRAAIIAGYLGLSVEELLGNFESKIKAPTPEGERPITFDDFTYAMYEEGKELSEENKKRLLEMAIFFRQQQEKETQ